MVVAFDNRKTDQLNQEEPNPWQNIDVISNHEEEVRLFGSHTVLVHSVAMFLVTIIILIMLAICVLNCLHYTPTYLQIHPFPNRSDSISLKECGIDIDTAIPEEEVFTFAKESPVS